MYKDVKNAIEKYINALPDNDLRKGKDSSILTKEEFKEALSNYVPTKIWMQFH